MDNGSNENLIALVPNDDLRRLLTPKGEVVVADTLYCITPQGTVFAHLSDSTKLRRLVESGDFSGMQEVSEKLWQGEGLFLYKTFDDKMNRIDIAEEHAPESAPQLRGFESGPDINSFPVKNMNRITIAGKIIEEAIGTKKEGVEYLRSMKKRRLSASFYGYDYFFHAERGIEAQIEKKMWHGGWGRLENWREGTTIGFHGIIIREPLGQNLSEKLRSLYTARIDDVEVFGKKDGLALEVLREDFMLDSQVPYAFYPMMASGKITQEKIEDIARKLRSGYNGMSFDLLSKSHNTKCVGFVIDVPSEEMRYTYICGTSRWKGGSRQGKVLNKSGCSVKWGCLLMSAGKIVVGTVSVLVSKGDAVKKAEETGKSLIISGVKGLAESFERATPRYYVAGSTYAYAQDGRGYCGMIMYKKGFGR